MKRQYVLGLFVALCFLILLTSPTAAQDLKTKSFAERAAISDGVEYVPGEVLVKYREGVPEFQMKQLRDRLGARLMSTHRGGVRKLATPAGLTEQQLIDLLRDDPSVEYAELNTICHAMMIPNDPLYDPYQWHFPIINCPQAWDVSAGSGVVVGILDSGIAYENYKIPAYELDTVAPGVAQYMQCPDLAGTSFTAGYDFINNDSHPNDNDAHGTHVAGTVAQTTNNSYGVAGMAFDCTLMPVKILDYTGSGTAQTLADGLYWATDNGAQVINMSLGWTPGYNPGPTVQNAIQYAYNHGVVLVGSSGNAGVSPVSYPAAYPEVIAVGATRYDDQLAYYSQYGSAQEIVAPGGDIFIDQNGDGYGDGVLQMTFAGYDPGPPETLADPTDFGYWFYQGTSMSAPHVTALVAMMIANGQTGVENIRTILHETAVDLGATGWDQYYGYGRIDAYAALTYGGTPPVADFSGDPTSGDAPLTVDFTDLSSGSPTSWSWDFGDGVGTSTEQNPSYTYDTEGDYTVSLTATNAYGSDTETKTDYIHVTPGGVPPVADFSGDPTSGDAPLTVDFTDLSSGSPTSWSWDFGDGVGTSTEQNPSYTYDTEGDYTVSLTATNAYGSDTETKTDYIHVTPAGTPPVADFVGDPTSGDAPLTVDFTDLSSGSPTSWSWDFGDGVGTSTEQNPSYTYTEGGTYTVSLTATNAYGSDTEIKTDYITVSSVGCFMHVHDMAVSRKTGGPNCWGLCTVWIRDQNGAAVANATVYVTATGPVGGTYSGLTLADGSVSFRTGKSRNCAGEWCFEVTNVTHASCTYDAAANVVTISCESGHVSGKGEAVASKELGTRQGFYLAPNYPNPFSGMTSIRFNLPKAGYARLEVFNAAGRRVAKLVDREMPAGFHTVGWDASGAPSGIYFCRLVFGAKEASTRMILVQ